MNWIDFCPASRNRYATNNFGIKEELLECKHIFDFEKRRVEIALPGKKHIERAKKNIDEAFQYASLSSWRKDENGSVYDACYSVYSVSVTVKMIEIFKKRRGRKSRHFYRDLPPSEQQRVRRLLEAYEGIAWRAFSYWLRIVRWETQDGLIGQPEQSNFETVSGVSYGTSIVHPITKNTLGLGRGQFVAKPHSNIGKDEWKNVQRLLICGDEPPMWAEIFFEGEYMEHLGNYRVAVVDYAVAVEVYLRDQFITEIPSDVDNAVFKIIDMSTHTRRIFDDYYTKKYYISKRLKSDVQKLINLRDDAVHRGRSDIKEEECKACKIAARKLMLEANKSYRRG